MIFNSKISEEDCIFMIKNPFLKILMARTKRINNEFLYCGWSFPYVNHSVERVQLKV